jgi:hypothetical protein
LIRPPLLVLVLLTSCLDSGDPGEAATLRLPLDAFCEVTVRGVGTIDVEEDYLPHVVNCENGGAGYEALRAQAVAARSYMFYKLESSGSIGDGTSDQVYSCGREPRAEIYEAVRSTSGQVLMYRGIAICAFYVAGAIPSTASCVPLASDRDPTNTERYVTYNWGRSGDDITQSRLGWVNPGNLYNRGCNSQNGADCLSDQGWTYDDILRFYYGDDIRLETTVGSCVLPVEPDGDGDADGDVDGDADSDGDIDADGDGDGDSDGDADGDIIIDDGDLDETEFPPPDADEPSDGGPDGSLPPLWRAPPMSGGCQAAGRPSSSSWGWLIIGRDRAL